MESILWMERVLRCYPLTFFNLEILIVFFVIVVIHRDEEGRGPFGAFVHFGRKGLKLPRVERMVAVFKDLGVGGWK